MESHYSINIAKATSERHGFVHHAKMILKEWRESDALAVLADTRKRYPAPEFQCSLTHWDVRGSTIESTTEQPAPLGPPLSNPHEMNDKR